MAVDTKTTHFGFYAEKQITVAEPIVMQHQHYPIPLHQMMFESSYTLANTTAKNADVKVDNSIPTTTVSVPPLKLQP
jgi:hypothetical protein